jgi:hypothetical protein
MGAVDDAAWAMQQCVPAMRAPDGGATSSEEPPPRASATSDDEAGIIGFRAAEQHSSRGSGSDRADSGTQLQQERPEERRLLELPATWCPTGSSPVPVALAAITEETGSLSEAAISGDDDHLALAFPGSRMSENGAPEAATATDDEGFRVMNLLLRFDPRKLRTEFQEMYMCRMHYQQQQLQHQQ